MATTVGAAVLSNELVVAQSDEVALGTEVQTLVIEFDQRKFEGFLSSRASNPVKTRKCRRVSYETSAPAASAESSRVNLENRSPSLKDEAPKVSQQAKRWVVKQPNPTSEAISRASASTSEPRSRRAKQRQRQNQARRRARALVSLDGFHYRPKVVEQAEGRNDEKHDKPRHRTPNSEPHRQQEVHSKQDEHCPHNEPRFQHEVPLKQGEPRPDNEPRFQNEVPSKQDEHRPSGEPRHQHELRRQNRMKRQPHQVRQPLSREARWCEAHPTEQACSKDEPRPRCEVRQAQEDEPQVKNRPKRRMRQNRPTNQLRPKHVNDEVHPVNQARRPLSRGSRLFKAKLPELAGGNPTSDLRGYLTCKRSVNQMQSHNCCEKLIFAMMAQCPSACQPTVFERLSNPSTRRRRFQDCHYPGVTINMVGRSKSRVLTDSPESSDPEYSPGLRGALTESQGVYRRTRIRTGAAIPFDYRQLTGGTHEEFENSGMATSQPSNTDLSDQASVLMADKEEEMAKKIEEQQALILAQQESIRRLEAMMEELTGKKKEGHSVSSEAESNQRTKERDHTLHDFQKQLDALKLQGRSKELGVARPYPSEWDDVSYPPKFKPLNLVQFDGKSSPSQHIYSFQAQTGHIACNDPIMTRLFISTLKGVAFEWFRRLEPGSINSWRDLERLFMARFFDDDTEVSLATLLAEKQNKTESVSNFVKRFRNRSLRARDQVSEATLIEMCRNNISINILSNMGAVRTRSWKDLIRQGEQVENMLRRIDAEEPSEFRGDDDQANFITHAHAKEKDTLVIATTSSSKFSSR